MGDLLFSSEESDGVIDIPTFVKGVDQRVAKLQGSRPATMKRKLYVINDNLCVALGGREDEMFTFLRKLKAFFADPDFQISELTEFMNAPDEERSHLIAIVVACIPGAERHDFRAFFIGPMKRLDNERYQQIIAAGTGVNQFFEFVSSNPKFDTDINNDDAFLVLHQYLMSYWLGQEVVSTESLLNRWGGGFEMIYFENNRFMMLEEYTVVLLQGKIGKNVKLDPAPFNTIIFYYQQDVLMIRAFSMGIQKIFAVPAIDEEKEGITAIQRSYAHPTLLITYIVWNVDTNVEQLPTVVFPRNKNVLEGTPVLIEQSGDELLLTIDSRFNDYIETVLTKMAD